MADSEHDQHGDPAAVREAFKVASRVLASFGTEPSTAVRAPGWSNTTWLAGDLAVQVKATDVPGGGTSEEELVRRLPTGARHPEYLASGTEGGRRWMLTRRVPGQNLGEMWPRLSWRQRTEALAQLWAKAEVVHSALDLLPLAGRRSPFYPPNAEEADALVRRLRAVGAFLPGRAERAEAIIASYWQALPEVELVLNHGDLSPVNALWDGRRVVALLDFEFAVAAPVELDLNELLKLAYAPGELEVAVADPSNPGRRRLQGMASKIATTTAHPRCGRDLLLGYAVMLEMWGVQRWFTTGSGKETLDQALEEM